MNPSSFLLTHRRLCSRHGRSSAIIGGRRRVDRCRCRGRELRGRLDGKSGKRAAIGEVLGARLDVVADGGEGVDDWGGR